jgi:hypothetical protein
MLFYLLGFLPTVGMVLDEVFEVSFLVRRQASKLHSHLSCSYRTERDFVNVEIRNDCKWHPLQPESLISQEYVQFKRLVWWFPVIHQVCKRKSIHTDILNLTNFQIVRPKRDKCTVGDRKSLMFSLLSQLLRHGYRITSSPDSQGRMPEISDKSTLDFCG